MMKKIVIIPAYNESASIISTVEDIKQNAPDFDYIIINDRSTDETYQVCIDNNLNVLNLPLNLGIGGAVQTGYWYALENGYDIAVQFDGDGQHDAKYLDEMVEHLVKHKCNPSLPLLKLKNSILYRLRDSANAVFAYKLGILFFEKMYLHLCTHI